ncbi:hypothetical protein BDR05DRAFT_957641 [Suillus weaverae]|nr:hypothetical protein BDR05DRAFT_957641 [Suillus weaverae]
MARILFLFEQLGSNNIILGGFGIGAYRRPFQEYGRSYLVGEKARFARSFHRVIFTLLGEDTLSIFKGVFDN